MKKVKSRRAAATPTRKAKARVEATGKAGGKAKARVAKVGTRPKAGAKPVRRDAKKPVKLRKGAKAVRHATPELQIRELDPLRICGDRTSVIQLFRVDEQLAGGKVAGARQVHLVFNDRHGWYCEHGRSCHAVSAVMRHAGIR